jgi:hypothetical protein
MVCNETIGRGVGACTVTNYLNHADKPQGRPNVGTVAMRIDERGRTQFFAFGPDNKLAPSAALDSEGQKTVPRLCTPCHVGQYDGTTANPDLGAVFREFEPSLLEMVPTIDPDRAQLEWKRLNLAVRGANKAVRSQAEGGPFGVDAAKARMENLFTELYPSNAETAVSIDALSRVPASWKQGGGSLAAAKVAMWRTTVSHYCAPCHRTAAPPYNFDDYGAFTSLTLPFHKGQATMTALVTDDPEDPNREELPFMPQAKLSWERLRSDDDAMLAIENWLDAATDSP